MFAPNQSLKHFKNLVVESEAHLKTLDKRDEIVSFIEEKSKELVSADVVFLLDKEDDRSYRIANTGNIYDIKPEKTSIVAEVLGKKQPLLVKDVKNSLLYNAKRDNLIDEAIKDVLVIPLQLVKSKKEPPQAMLWAAVKESSEGTLLQKQTLYLIKFLEALKHYFIVQREETAGPAGITLQQCIEHNEEMEAMLERNKRYFHSIIHDVRTPMNALLGFLELLSLNEEDTTKQDYLLSALKSGEHIVRLINDALDVAKIESGELPVEKKPFSLHDELEDTIKIFFETANKKNLMLCAFIDPSMPEHVTSDAYRIKQVLSNLLSNAIKFTPEGGSILIEAVYDKAKDTVTIAVEDTGKGIKKEALGTIFAAYKQEDSSTERQYGGTGLGLNISYQIVALLGGQLEVESEIGRGSRFYFTLPALTPKDTPPLCKKGTIEGNVRLYRWKGRDDLRAMTIVRYLEKFGVNFVAESQETSLRQIYKENFSKDDIFIVEKHHIFEYDYEYAQLLLDNGCRIVWLEDIFDITFNYFKGEIKKLSYPVLTRIFYDTLHFESKAQKEAVRIIDETAFVGKKVLVVDDNRINLKFMDAILKKLHIHVTLLDDAESALDELEKDSFDLLFIDENMPKMLGSEAIRIIKEKIASGKMQSMALISLSGDSHHKDLILQAGADEVMTKPVKLEELHEVLNKYLG